MRLHIACHPHWGLWGKSVKGVRGGGRVGGLMSWLNSDWEPPAFSTRIDIIFLFLLLIISYDTVFSGNGNNASMIDHRTEGRRRRLRDSCLFFPFKGHNSLCELCGEEN